MIDSVTIPTTAKLFIHTTLHTKILYFVKIKVYVSHTIKDATILLVTPFIFYYMVGLTPFLCYSKKLLLIR